MASLADIRAGLKANLVAAGFTDVNLYTLSNPTAPCFEIDLDAEGVDYDLAFNRGWDQINMVVRVLLVESESSSINLDTYIDGAAGTDVKTALETDGTLGGAADAIQVTGATPAAGRTKRPAG